MKVNKILSIDGRDIRIAYKLKRVVFNPFGKGTTFKMNIDEFFKNTL